MTDELEALLAAAKSAEPGDRINLRDPIAAHGVAAITTMESWISDPRLGAFAVRVLERIASHAVARPEVVRALRSAEHARLSHQVSGDVSAALERLAPVVQTKRPGPASVAPVWPRDHSVTDLEREFHEAMLGIFTKAGEATRKQRPDGSFIRGYWASYFLRGVRNHGGPAYAHQLCAPKEHRMASSG